MSEETILSAPAEAPASSTGTASTTAAGSTTRKKAPAKAATPARRNRQRLSASDSQSSFGAAALASESRAQNPSTDDPFQSGQRIWPD